MTGWNLPPGVEVSDLPGNRPDDIECEEEEMKGVCSWCGKHLHGPKDAKVITHGICRVCEVVEVFRIDVLKELNITIDQLDRERKNMNDIMGRMRYGHDRDLVKASRNTTRRICLKLAGLKCRINRMEGGGSEETEGQDQGKKEIE